MTDDDDDLPPHVWYRDTSVAAAESLRDVVGRLNNLIFFAIVAQGSHGYTCDEIEVNYDLRHQTASSRITFLHQNSYIVDSGRRRITRSGRNAIVWIVSEPQAQDAAA